MDPVADLALDCDGRERRGWEPMRLVYVGSVGDVLRGGGGKLSPTGGDPGDSRKQSGPGH